MNSITQLLDELQIYSFRLRLLNLQQISADYDFLCAYLGSDKWDNPLKKSDFYLAPHPAGKNTIDAYSHNCPIPYTLDWTIKKKCYDADSAVWYLKRVNTLLYSLRELVSDPSGVTAINEYLNYTYEASKLLGGDIEPPGPTPPGPEPPGPTPPEPTIMYCGGLINATEDIGYTCEVPSLLSIGKYAYSVMPVLGNLDMYTYFGMATPGGYAFKDIPLVENVSIITTDEMNVGSYLSTDTPLAFGVYNSGGFIADELYLGETAYPSSYENGQFTVNGITDTWEVIHNLGYTFTPSNEISFVNEPTASGEIRLKNDEDGFYYSQDLAWDSTDYPLSAGLMTSTEDIQNKFYMNNKTMGQPDIRSYPFIETPIIQPGVMIQFPSITFYSAVPAGGQDPVNPSGLNFNQNNIVAVGANYACFPENSTSSDDQYPYIDGSFSAAYTNQASQSIYTYTDHWLLGSSGWDAVSYFIVRNINGKERIQNEGTYNRTLSGVLLTYIDDNDFSIIQIVPNGKSIMIYAAKVLRNGEYYYYPLMTNSPGWKTEEELYTAGELGFTLYKDGEGNYIEKKLVRKVSNVSSSTSINIRDIPALNGSTVLTQLAPGNDVYGKWKEVYNDPNTSYTYKWQRIRITVSGGSEVDGYIDISNSSLQNRVIPVNVDFNIINNL